MKWVQISLNEGPHPSPMRDDSVHVIVEMHINKLFVFYYSKRQGGSHEDL